VASPRADGDGRATPTPRGAAARCAEKNPSNWAGSPAGRSRRRVNNRFWKKRMCGTFFLSPDRTVRQEIGEFYRPISLEALRIHPKIEEPQIF
jgi:hypothetical protein